MRDPIVSLVAWFNVVGHGPAQEGLYRGFCYEEMAELTKGLSSRGAPFHTANVLAMAEEHDEALGTMLKAGAQFPPRSRNQTLDDHLDSAWVHLGAALAMLGGSHTRLEEAWRRLDHANIEAKRWPDGTFHRDANGKILKPEGWKPPTYEDLL